MPSGTTLLAVMFLSHLEPQDNWKQLTIFSPRVPSFQYRDKTLCSNPKAKYVFSSAYEFATNGATVLAFHSEARNYN